MSLKLLENNKSKKAAFYKLMKKIKKTNRKYMNRIDIIELVRMKQGTAGFRTYKKYKCPLKLEEIKMTLRILIS